MTAPDPVPARPALLLRRNPLALPALVLGVIAEIVGAAFDLGRTAAITAQASGSAGSITQVLGIIGLIQTVVVGLIGLAALVLGLIALIPANRPRRAVAGAGTAIGAVIVFGVVVSLLSTALLSAASS